MMLGAPELLIVLAFLISPVFAICAAVSASRYPEAAFERAGTSKTLWIVMPLVGIAFCGIVGLVSAIVWFSSFRARVAAASPPPPPAIAPPPPPQ